MNTQQESQSVFDILIVSSEIREKLFYDFDSKIVFFPLFLGPETEFSKLLRWPVMMACDDLWLSSRVSMQKSLP